MDREMYVRLKGYMESTIFQYGTDDEEKEPLIYRLYDIMLYKMICGGLFPCSYSQKELEEMFCLDDLGISEKNYLSTCGVLISGILQEMGWRFERYYFCEAEMKDFYASKDNILMLSLRQRILREVSNYGHYWHGATVCLINNPLIDYVFGEESPLPLETREYLEERAVDCLREAYSANIILFWWGDNYYWLLIARGNYEGEIPIGWIRNINLLTPFYGKFLYDIIKLYLQES